MEEKESTVSGSLGGDSYSDSPPPVSSNVSLPQPPPPQPPQPPQQAMSMGTTERNLDLSSAGGTTAVMATPQGNSGSGVDLMGKKKRGRPRKYDSDGNLRVPQSLSSVVSVSPPSSGFSLSPSPEFSTSKKSRGRSSGSGNWQLLGSLGELFMTTAGADFTAHIVTVNTGEDVAAKIFSLVQKGPRGVCVLSANGAVSNVTIRQPGSSGGILTYEGRFEILSLSGSITVCDNSGVRRNGGLSVSLAGPDGRVVGGGVAGLLLAASPIQIVVGTFLPNSGKVQKRKYQRHHTTVSHTSAAATDTAMAARQMSQIKPDGETPIPGQSHLAGADNSQMNKHMLNAPNVTSSHFVAGWNGSDTLSNQRPSPDINVSLATE